MADNKVMAEASAEVGRTIPVTRDIDTTDVPGDYHDYKGSNSKMVADTYSSRMGKLEAALGNKDSVKG